MNRPTLQGGSVELLKVSMCFGALRVTDEIDIEMRPGEVLSIVGPSGCGKTTLLRAVAGLQAPKSGEVRIDGVPVAGASAEGVSMVFQHFGLFPWKTVEANISYPLVVQGVRKRDAILQTRRLLEMVGLTGFESSYPHQLSGGMQQRTGLARALAINPRVLLMDEPFGALDAQTREILQFEVLDLLSASEITTLFVTHSIEEAVLFGDRIAVLRGKPSQIVELIDVNLPKPRNRSIMSTPDFARLREQVWNLVMAKDFKS